MQNSFDDFSKGQHRYYPRKIPVIGPRGKGIYEFLIIVHDEIGVLSRIAAIFYKHGINMNSYYGYLADGSSKLVVQTIFCDFSQADCSVEQLASELESLPFVREIRWVSTERHYHDQFLFPITVLGNKRAVLLLTDNLLKIELKLSEKFGSGGAAIMFEEGRNYSKDWVDCYSTLLAGLDSDSKLEVVKDGLTAMGWGILEMRRGRGVSFEVIVKDPIVLFIEDPSGEMKMMSSSFFVGIISGIVENIFGEPVEASEIHYDKSRNTFAFKIKSRNDHS
jgi:hypothetical protein